MRGLLPFDDRSYCGKCDARLCRLLTNRTTNEVPFVSAYGCGPTNFVETVSSFLGQIGYDTARITYQLKLRNDGAFRWSSDHLATSEIQAVPTVRKMAM